MSVTLTTRESLKTQTATFFKDLQLKICKALEVCDGKERFSTDNWDHTHGGGGTTRVIQNGGVFEKGGVNFSNVSGILSDKIAAQLNVKPQSFFAAGISLVLHPWSPMIPTVHFNLRYLEMQNGDGWFGGGADLTPFYLFEDDVLHFHKSLKEACDRHNPDYYRLFKSRSDEYFFIKHRAETRGVGGIFFDYLRHNPGSTFEFVRDLGESFIPSYVPIVEKRREEKWGEKEKRWQMHRRGRYAEFNLVYDRGTLFGLETEGRVESILMSLPPSVEWRYNFTPEAKSREAALLEVLRKPREWV